ncbi:SsgA family sporulation/cell division regulator [Streptomyces sp. NBC_01353]|uniref:SsgA family sporulation/cell division regulator n=1 Tax=Streptomyces sp. NBC_01353 TaxID=2903835 RepID=UPI003DA1DAEB
MRLLGRSLEGSGDDVRARTTGEAGGDGRPRVRPWCTTVRQIHDGVNVLLEATFGYDPDDPWAVQACFRDPLGRLVAWNLSRELLRSGTYGLSGEGEVRLWPLRSGGGYVRMRLGREAAGFARLPNAAVE